jgi:glycosyltransferase involved in cell wall biosynthesis
MHKVKHKVLVIAPGRKTRGGITAVVEAYTKTPLWKQWNCYWLESYIDKSSFQKILYFIKSFFIYIFIFPFYDIIHIHLSEPVSAIRKSFFFVIAKTFRKKVIIHFHSFSPETTLKGKYSWLYKKLFSRADCVIVLSETWKRETADILEDSSHVTVLYNPSPVIDLSINKNTQKEKYILYAGTLNSRKGYSDLLKAFSLIAGKHPEWKLYFAGNGEIQKARELANELGIAEKVEFKGWVSGGKKNDLFNSAEIFCLPSYAEGFPMAVIDAMAYSLPVVTTTVGGIMDVFENERDILAFSPGDINTLAEKLDVLVSDPEKRTKLANNAINIIKRKFDILQVASKLDIIYKKLLG